MPISADQGEPQPLVKAKRSLGFDPDKLDLRGRPSKFTQEIAGEILERIAQGEPLTKICRGDPRMPAPRTVLDWERADTAFSTAIARARDDGADAIAAEALAIADTPVAGERSKTTAAGTETWKEDMLGHRKLQVETRIRLLAVWNPRKYSERVIATAAAVAAGSDQQPDLPDGAVGITLTPAVLADLRARRKAALSSRSRIENMKPVEGKEIEP